jgi:response regulator RpfG family c-di-GMP phosphodiesterase
MLLQGTLDSMPTDESISRFIFRGLKSVPGASSLNVCIRGAVAEKNDLCASCNFRWGEAEDNFDYLCKLEDYGNTKCFPIRLVDRLYGFVVFSLNDPLDAFAPYEPYLQNVVNFIALSIDNRRQRQALDVFNKQLQREVEQRKQAEAVLQESHAKLERNLKGAIDVISETIERKGSYAPGHHRRVAALASAIAQEMRMTDFQVQGIGLAAAVFDIGLIDIPIEFLQDNERLDGIKLTLYQGYPQAGHDALKKIEFPWPIADIILQHRECFDGSGFPRGIKGEEILIEARILAVASDLEDLTTHRSFRNAFPLSEALEKFSSHSGAKYDPKVVAACLRLLREKVFKFEPETVARI